MKAILVTLALVAASLSIVAPTASARCALPDLACTCGIEFNDACGYDSCAVAVILHNGWESTSTPDGGAGFLCQARHGTAPVVLYL